MRLALFVLSLLVVAACAPKREQIPETPELTSERKKVVIYQMMTRLFANTNTTNKPFGTREENGVGKFNDITAKALEGIKELGVTHIWYTGILEHALITDFTAAGIPLDDPDVIKGRAGSPYAIKDYYDVNPDLATRVPDRMKEFEQLVERTHAASLKVIIDFVPNHVARSYHSDKTPDGVEDFGASDDVSKPFSVNNNFYYLPGQAFKPPADLFRRFKFYFPTMDGKFNEVPAKATGNDVFTATPSENDWFEATKLNYGVDYRHGAAKNLDSIPDTWYKMRDILVYWAGKQVDGFRCDVAEMVPVEFWNWVIPQVKAVNPEIIFIAEIYTPVKYRAYIDEGRFDFLYDKVQLYDTLRLLINGKAAATDVAGIRQWQAGITGNLVHFLENHDEQRIASRFFAGDPRRALPGMVVSSFIDEGPVMIYFGQEVGEPASEAEGFGGDDGRTTMFDYWGVPEHQKWVNGGLFDGGLLSDAQKELRNAYVRILSAAATSTAVADGEYVDLTQHNVTNQTTSNRVVSFARWNDLERLIVIAGFNWRDEPVQLKLTPELMAAWKLSTTSNYKLKDLLGDTTNVSLAGEQGISLTLPPFGSRVYQVISN